MTSSEARKSLMLGLIYPAVLGSVLYSAIQAAVDPVMETITGSAVWRFDRVVAFKLLVLLVVIVFFGCDYLYITFTKSLRAWFFAADCVFIVLMYVVWWAIDIKSAAATEPKIGVVLIALVLFMVTYLVWDIAERDSAKGRERIFFSRVIAWEVGSIVALVAMCIGLAAGHYSRPVFVVIVTLITAIFAALAWHKRQYA